MNLTKLEQVVFHSSAPAGTGRRTPCRPRVRSGRPRVRIPRRPGEPLIFFVSFLMFLVGVFPTFLYALPQDGTVQAGSATIDPVSPERLNINQTTDRAIIDWRSFSIGANEHVDFRVPSAGSVTLNRVTGGEASRIFGRLSSNGGLWLINPNGILFGQGARVDVHSLMATTTDILNRDFMEGRFRFDLPADVPGVVVNRGTVNVAEGGLLAFVAPGVENSGVINARLGRVHLASGNTFTLDLYGDQLVNLGVDAQVAAQVTGLDGNQLSSLVNNSGTIFADGGTVMLEVNAARGVVDRVLNMSGIVQARTAVEREGKIILLGGDEGAVEVSGLLDASGRLSGEVGGTVHVLGNRVGLFDGALLDVSGDLGGGTVLVGGDFQGLGTIPTASDTFVASGASIFADALTAGDGGRAIFWADRRTRFSGRVRARGGRLFGDGGFVEISGKEELLFDGSVDTLAPNGKAGTLLLDPPDLLIADGSGAASAAVVYEQALEAVSGTTNLQLSATNSITLGNLTDNLLNLKQVNGTSVKFTASNGQIVFLDANDKIQTAGGDIEFSAGGFLTIGALNSNGGNITLKGDDLFLLNTVNSGAGNTTLLVSDGGAIGLGSTTCGGTCGMSVDSTELGRILANKLIVGGVEGGDVYVNGVTISPTNVPNGVELNVPTHVSGSAAVVVFESSPSSFPSLTAGAAKSIQVNSNLTTVSGDLILDGDSDNAVDPDPGNDSVVIAGGVALTSAGDLSLSALNGGISGAGTLTLNAAGAITINHNLTAAGAAALNAGTGITLGSGITLTGGGLTLDTVSGSISAPGGITLSSTGSLTVNDPFTATGAATLTANTGITLNGDVTAGGNLVLDGDADNAGTASDKITLAGGLTLSSTGGNITLDATTGGISAPGAVTLNAANVLTVNDAFTSTGAATLTANSGINLNGDFTSAGATLLNADLDNNGTSDLTVATGKTVSTGNNPLTIRANDIFLNGSINSGSAGTTITVSDGGTLGLGFDTGFGMNLSAAELGRITEGGLTFTSDDITLAATLPSLSSGGRLTLGSGGGTITGQGATTLSANDGILLNNSVTSAGNLVLEGDANNAADGDDRITLAAGTTLTATAGGITMDATTGGVSTLGPATLTAATGITVNDNLVSTGGATLNGGNGITLNGDFTAAGTTTLNADSDANGTGGLTLAAGKTLSTTNNALNITTNGFNLNGTLNSGGAETTLEVALAGNTIGLGDALGNLTITGAELGRITAGTLTLGGSTNGGITVDNVSEIVTDPFGTFTLNATAPGSSVTFLNNPSTFNALTVNAGAGITVSADLATDTGGLSLAAGNGVVLNANVTTAGATTLNTDTNGDGTGNLNIAAGKALTTTNNSLSIESNALVFNGTGQLNSGTASTTIDTARAGDTIGLGNALGNLTLNGTDLAQIFAGSLVIGGAGNGGITVDTVTAVSPLTLNSTGAGGTVQFVNGASNFTGLTVNAGSGGIFFGSDLLLTGNLNVTSGGAITDTGALTVAGTSAFTTNVPDQAIVLDSLGSAFTGPVTLNTLGSLGNATLVSGNALTLGASSIGGTLSVTAGGGNSLNVQGAQTAGNGLSLLADDDVIFSALGDLTALGGNILVTADNDGNANGLGGALTMADGTVFNAGNGTLALRADENILLGRLITGNASNTAVSLTSTSGGVFDADMNQSLDIDAALGRLVADTVTGFGTAANPIETRVGSLDMDNTVSGNIDLFETDSLNIFKINQAGPGDIRISYSGALTGQDNATVTTGEKVFTNRSLGGNQLVGNTGKTLDELSVERTTQNSASVDSEVSRNLAQGARESNKTITQAVAENGSGPVRNVFSEDFGLVELSGGSEKVYSGVRGFEQFWNPDGTKGTELAKRSSKSKKKQARVKIRKRGKPKQVAKSKSKVRKKRKKPERVGEAASARHKKQSEPSGWGWFNFLR